MNDAPQKLVIVITDDDEANTLIEKLVERGYPATKVSSTGGFLRKGSATILSGIDSDDVDPVLAIIRTECPPRTEYVPAQATPFPDTALPREPIPVRVGGAIVFVLPVERFLKT